MGKGTLSSTQFKKLSAPTGSPFPPQLTSLQLIEVNSKIQVHHSGFAFFSHKFKFTFILLTINAAQDEPLEHLYISKENYDDECFFA